MLNTPDSRLRKFLLSALGDNPRIHDDPTVVGFSMYIDFNGAMSDKSIYHGASPLFCELDNKDSAIRYLKAIGEDTRAEKLKSFKTKLQDLIVEFPYYFTSISGLQGLTKIEEGTSWRLKDFKLTVETLESIEMRVTNIIEDYIAAVYDFQYARHMLPENLRTFFLEVQITEIRNFKSFTQDSIDPDGEITLKSINDQLSVMVYDFYGCKFDFADSHPFLDTVKQVTEEGINNKFSITAERCIPRHDLRFLDLINPPSAEQLVNPFPSNLKTNPADGLTGKIKEKTLKDRFLSNILSNVSTIETILGQEAELIKSRLNPEDILLRVANQLESIVFNKLISLALGNVFTRASNFFRDGDLLENVQKFIEAKTSELKSSNVDVAKFVLSDNNLGDLFDLFPDFTKANLGTFENPPISPNGTDLGDIINVDVSPNGSNLGDIISTEFTPNGTSTLNSVETPPIPENNTPPLGDKVDTEIPENKTTTLDAIPTGKVSENKVDGVIDVVDDANNESPVRNLNVVDANNNELGTKILPPNENNAKFEDKKLPVTDTSNKVLDTTKLFDFAEPEKVTSLGGLDVSSKSTTDNVGYMLTVVFDETKPFDQNTVDLEKVSAGIKELGDLFDVSPSINPKTLDRQDLQSSIVSIFTSKLEPGNKNPIVDLYSANIKDFDKAPISALLQNKIASTLGNVFTREDPIKNDFQPRNLDDC